MPERTIQKIKIYGSHRGRRFVGRYYINISYETWRTFDLKKFRTRVLCEINSLFDKDQKSVFNGSESGYCIPHYEYNYATKEWIYTLEFSSQLVRSIGIREGLYVDMLLTRIDKFGGNVVHIFPKISFI